MSTRGSRSSWSSMSDTAVLDPSPEQARERAAQIALELLSGIPYCPWTPNPGPQSRFLLDFGKEALYGGAAGGGKSIALLMAASMFLHVPGYSALLLRKSFSELNKPGALMDIGEDWWRGQPGTKFDTQDNTWFFECPGGGRSRIVFGYLDKVGDKEKYQGGAYQFVGFDELTHFRETDYRYLFSRQRKVDDPDNPVSRIPIRMRSTTNPGGPGHAWVFKRFVGPYVAWREHGARRPPRNFYPALLSDNPKLNREDYTQSLMELDPVTRAQLLRGDWNIRPEGRMFKSKWFKEIKIADVPAVCAWVRFWDMASTEEDPDKEKKRGGPDFTVGGLIGRDTIGNYYIADIQRWRKDAGLNDLLLGAVATHDTSRIPQIMEQEPGSSGKTAIYHYRSGPFEGMNFRGIPSTGSKVVRASPVASYAEQGRVFVVTDGTWDVEAFYDEIEQFPDPGVHDDQVDAISGAFSVLAKLFLGKISFGEHMNNEFRRENPWRPDVTLVLSPADLSAGGGLLNERVANARMDEKQMRSVVARAWAV